MTEHLANLPALTAKELDVLERALLCYAIDLGALHGQALQVSEVPVEENQFIAALLAQQRIVMSLTTAAREATYSIERMQE